MSLRNDRTSTCYRCGGRADPGTAYLEKMDRARLQKLGAPPTVREGFKVQHFECAAKYRGTSYSKWNKGEAE